MKKTLAILLALVLVLANVAALASETEEPAYTPTEGGETFTITKTYDGDATATVFPKETLEFVSEPNDENPTTENITVGTNNTFAVTSNSNTITVTLPSYSMPGVYYYTVTETAGSTQGVTYTDAEISIGVVVIFDEDDPAQLVVSEMYGVIKVDDEKQDELTNTYSVADLTITKAVSGNLGDKTKYFPVEVVFNAAKTVRSDITITGETGEEDVKVKSIPAGENGWTGEKKVTIYVKDSDEVVFENIPVDVTYTVVETDATKHVQAASEEPNNVDAYKVGGEVTTAATLSADASVDLTNEKSIEIDTGVSLETVPYIMILAVVMIGAALLVLRKREEY